MRTLVVSDLHLGAASGKDLARRAELRAPLIEALRDVDRLVVLGDGLELREAPHRDAATFAGPFFAEAGAALGPDGELLVLAGNHDHGLVAGWIDARLQSEPSGFLGLSEPVEPSAAGPLAERLADLARPARMTLAYPGAWLRDDVFALHGHYVDLHSTVPTFERLAAGAMARWVVRLPESGARPDDYEAALAPLYALLHQLTQRSDHAAVSAGAGASARAWVAMAGRGRARHPVRAAALGDRVRERRRRDQRARARAGRPRPVGRRAAARRAARDPRGAAAAGDLRPARAVRAHAPRRPVAGRRRVGVASRADARAGTPARGSTSRTSSATRRAGRPTGRGPRS